MAELILTKQEEKAESLLEWSDESLGKVVRFCITNLNLEKENDADRALLLYNYAVLEMMNGKGEHAITLLEQLHDKCFRSAEPEEAPACLLVPSTEPDESDFEERWGLPVREAAKLLGSYIKGQSSAARENGD